MLTTTSPVLASSSRNASPRTLQFGSAKSPRQGSPGRSRSGSRRPSPTASSSQSPTMTITSTAARATSSLVASPSSTPRTQNGAEDSSIRSTDNPSHVSRQKQAVVPVEALRASSESTGAATAQECPQQAQPAQSKPSSAKRSAGSPALPPSLSAVSQQLDHAAAGVSDRPAQRPKPQPAAPKILPLAYETCNIGDMVVLIAHMISELIETNDALALSSGNLTRFHSRTAPGISVVDYLNRLARHATLSPPLLLSMVYYIDRLCALYPEFTINTLTVHRFLITAATVAAKGLSDSFWNNATYAKVGGVRLAELKLLELEFLYRVDWRIIPNPDVLVAYYQGLVERCPGYTLEQSPPPASSESDDDRIEESDSSEDGGSPQPGSTEVPVTSSG